jgi:hypothetical protein
MNTSDNETPARAATTDQQRQLAAQLRAQGKTPADFAANKPAVPAADAPMIPSFLTATSDTDVMAKWNKKLATEVNTNRQADNSMLNPYNENFDFSDALNQFTTSLGPDAEGSSGDRKERIDQYLALTGNKMNQKLVPGSKGWATVNWISDPTGKVVNKPQVQNNADSDFALAMNLAAATAGGAIAGPGVGIGGKAATGAITSGGLTALSGGGIEDILKSAVIGGIGAAAGARLQSSGIGATASGAATGALRPLLSGGNTSDVIRGAAGGGAAGGLVESGALKGLDPTTTKLITGGVSGGITGKSPAAAILGAITSASGKNSPIPALLKYLATRSAASKQKATKKGP